MGAGPGDGQGGANNGGWPAQGNPWGAPPTQNPPVQNQGSPWGPAPGHPAQQTHPPSQGFGPAGQPPPQPQQPGFGAPAATPANPWAVPTQGQPVSPPAPAQQQWAQAPQNQPPQQGGVWGGPTQIAGITGPQQALPPQAQWAPAPPQPQQQPQPQQPQQAQWAQTPPNYTSSPQNVTAPPTLAVSSEQMNQLGIAPQTQQPQFQQAQQAPQQVQPGSVPAPPNAWYPAAILSAFVPMLGLLLLRDRDRRTFAFASFGAWFVGFLACYGLMSLLRGVFLLGLLSSVIFFMYVLFAAAIGALYTHDETVRTWPQLGQVIYFRKPIELPTQL